MLLAVSGWRGLKDKKHVWNQLDRMERLGYAVFRVGCARGVDKYTRQWLEGHNYLWTEYRADWETNGNAAGMIRNVDMLMGRLHTDPLPGRYPDLLLAIPQPGVHLTKDSGTFGCIKSAVKLGIAVYIPPFATGVTISGKEAEGQDRSKEG